MQKIVFHQRRIGNLSKILTEVGFDLLLTRTNLATHT
jgi:hypothetical protein